MDINSIIQALRNYFSAPQGDETADAAKAVDQQVAQQLPESLMPNQAIAQQNARLALIDQQLRDAEK